MLEKILKRKPAVEDQRITENFTVAECACRCGCGMLPDPAFMVQVQAFRDRWGKPFSPTSAARCPSHNKDVGGSEQSYHKLGRAFDIPVESGRERYRMVALAIHMGFNGIGVAETFIHIDNRDKPAMWTYD